MSEPDHDRLSAVFVAIANLDASERRARLDELCGDDEALRREVESLLRHHDHRGLELEPILDPPTPSAELLDSLERAAETSVPERIGRYRILDRLGEGGMGVVYRAEPERPLRREVAIKVIKPGMDSAAIIARFTAERAALALMEHPGIARVLDAGSTEDGRPYFVMELVHGAPITTYCDRRQLSIADRVRLFIGVCEAVQHAHQKGIIHRDLKPSNILVEVHDGRPIARVIDFGVAKALATADGGSLSDLTMMTHAGQLVGTPAYMSPEQADSGGADIDTRTDIWSLGTLLYELLVGATPLDGAMLRQRSVLDVARLITESDPPPPATRLAGIGSSDPEGARRIASARRIDATTLRRVLSGELGWIVMKCLERDRKRRYESTSELARDLRRHLDGEPVLAVPPSRAYRLSKFVRRHRVPVTASIAVALTLVAATAVSLRFGVREAEQRAVVERQRAELAEIVDFQAQLLAAIDPVAMGQGVIEQLRRQLRRSLVTTGAEADVVDASVAELDALLMHANPTDLALHALDAHVLRAAADALGDRFADQPIVEAALRHTIAEIYQGIGLLPEAVPQIDRALHLRNAHLGAEHIETIRTERLRARSVFLVDADLPRAIDDMLAVIEALERLLGRDHTETLDTMLSLVAFYRVARLYDDAEDVTREVHARSVETHGPSHATTLHAQSELGNLLVQRGDRERADALLDDAFERSRGSFGDTATLTLRIANDHSQVLAGLGRLVEAEERLRFALEGRRHVLGRDHPHTLTSLNNLGLLVRRAGRDDEAEALYREALETSRRVHSQSSPTTLTLQHNLAILLQSTGRLDEAEPLLQATLRQRNAVLGPEHPDSLRTLGAYGGLLMLKERHDESIAIFEQALRLLSAQQSAKHPDVLRAHHNIASALRSAGRPTDAETHHRLAYEGRYAVFGPTGRETLGSAIGLARVLLDCERFDEAHALASATLRDIEMHADGTDPRAAALQALIEEIEAAAATTEAVESP